MNVLIVAKTRIGGDHCVGALNGQNQSLRLYESDWTFPSSSGPYDIGQIWTMKVAPKPDPVPPHIEDVAVISRKLDGTQSNLKKHLLSRIKPWTCKVTDLFEGKLGFTYNRHGYIEEPDIPSRSTWFWVPNQDLPALSERSYYKCGAYEIKYVGAAPMIDEIPAGALVRVSLARWWKQDTATSEFPLRCYLQLSGWYL